jgi:hypothetical protein
MAQKGGKGLLMRLAGAADSGHLLPEGYMEKRGGRDPRGKHDLKRLMGGGRTCSSGCAASARKPVHGSSSPSVRINIPAGKVFCRTGWQRRLRALDHMSA